MFTAILYTLPIRPEQLAQLEAYGRQHKTPLVAIHSAGFYSYFQINLPGAFPIVDTHPDETATTDLRLLTPWPELAVFAEELTRDIEGLDNFEHGHLPYVAILLHYLEEWKAAHDGKYPATYKEKTEFRKIVQNATRTDNPEGGEENFEEAAAAVLKTLVPPSLPAGLKEIFEYGHTDPVMSSLAHVPTSESPPADMPRHAAGRAEIRLLAHCRCRQAVLRDTQVSSPSWQASRHEGAVQGVHSATGHLQGQGAQGCSRDTANSAGSAGWRARRSRRSGSFLQKRSLRQAHQCDGRNG